MTAAVRSMNVHEKSAWKMLVGLGARPIDLGGKPGLSVLPIRCTSARKLELFAEAFLGACGQSGAVRRHTNRAGRRVLLVTDDEWARAVTTGTSNGGTP